MFQLFRFAVDGEFTVDSPGNMSGFFGYDNGNGIRDFRNSECRAVSQSQPFGYALVSRYRKNAGGCSQSAVRNDKGAIVQRAVFEKDIFYQTGTDACINNFGRLGIEFQVVGAGDDD